MKKLISIVIPAYNEESCVHQLSQALLATFNQLSQYDFEVIVVDNGSTDRTYDLLLEIHQRDSRFKVIQLSRNFTCDGGIAAGLKHIQGDAAVIMYADLQEPPEIIEQFLRKWEEGYLNVYGIIDKRQDGLIRGIGSAIFYWLVNKLSNNRIPKNVGDFRLVDQSVYQAINQMPEHNKIMRGLFAWTGAKSIGILYQRKKRVAGRSKANPIYITQFGLTAIFNFSFYPLVLITLLGFVMLLGTIFSFFLLWLFFGKNEPWLIILHTVVFLFGLTFLLMGILGTYVAIIIDEVKARPNYVITNKAGFNI